MTMNDSGIEYAARLRSPGIYGIYVHVENAFSNVALLSLACSYTWVQCNLGPVHMEVGDPG